MGFALAMLSIVPSAQASVQITTDPGTFPILELAGDASPDQIAVSYDGGSARLVFASAGISENTPACSDEGDRVTCAVPTASPGPTHAVVDFLLGDGDDRVTVAPTMPESLSFGDVDSNGADTFIGGPEADFERAGPGADIFTGGGGVDGVVYSQRVTPVSASLDGSPTSGNELDGLPGARDSIAPDVGYLVGGNASDRLVGNALGNTIVGFKGRDTLIGLGGADRLAGEGLDTTFAVGTATANRLLGGKGRDFLLGTAAGDQLFGGPGIDRINAKDKQHEKVISCGPGNDKRERATRDGGDPHPISC